MSTLIEATSEETSVQNTILPVIYQHNFVLAEEIQNINSWIQVASTRWIGLSAMSKIWSHSKSPVIISNFASWMNTLSSIALMGHESNSVRMLAVMNFGQLLKHCSQIPEVSRQVSNLIHSIFRDILSSNSRVPMSSLKCLKSILKYFSGSCLSFKGKMLKYLMPHLLSLDSTVQTLSIRCWCYIPHMGIGGNRNQGRAFQWENQCNDALDALNYVTINLFSGQFNDDMVDPATLCLSLPFENLPEMEPDHTLALLQRFIALSKCLSKLLEVVELPVPVNVDCHQILSLLHMCCEITPKQLGYTSEKLLISKYLVNIHQCCLEVLNALTKCCTNHICQYAVITNQIFANLLTLWKDKPDTPGHSQKYNVIRSHIYAAIANWVQCCGAKSLSLFNPTSPVQSFLQDIIDDALTIQDNMDMTSRDYGISHIEENISKRSKHTKSKQLQTCARTYDHKAKNMISFNALRVARLCIYTYGPHLSQNIHMSLQEGVVKLLLKLVKRKEIVLPYSRCETSRKELYHLLLALSLSTNPASLPPLQFASFIFHHGSIHERGLEIRSFCTEAGVMLSHVVHPRAPALHRTSVDCTSLSRKNIEENRELLCENVSVTNGDESMDEKCIDEFESHEQNNIFPQEVQMDEINLDKSTNFETHDKNESVQQELQIGEINLEQSTNSESNDKDEIVQQEIQIDEIDLEKSKNDKLENDEIRKKNAEYSPSKNCENRQLKRIHDELDGSDVPALKIQPTLNVTSHTTDILTETTTSDALSSMFQDFVDADPDNNANETP